MFKFNYLKLKINETNYIVKDFNNDGYTDAFFSFMSSEEEDELEVEEVMIKGKMYYTDSHLNGDIYRVGDDGDIEDIVGKFEKSQAIFF